MAFPPFKFTPSSVNQQLKLSIFSGQTVTADFEAKTQQSLNCLFIRLDENKKTFAFMKSTLLDRKAVFPEDISIL